ncbi:hypothetical protein NDK43_26215 [Neobacillus pocheonensis]|uniref:Uncharacterized protein n=1 Tax=Neobacillus pocheonensis TaxID=363869 RepID=A0ABT0WI87_9BACI|nr:hypothetical protein [Neobacillus pocheonensis]
MKFYLDDEESSDFPSVLDYLYKERNPFKFPNLMDDIKKQFNPKFNFQRALFEHLTEKQTVDKRTHCVSCYCKLEDDEVYEFEYENYCIRCYENLDSLDEED